MKWMARQFWSGIDSEIRTQNKEIRRRKMRKLRMVLIAVTFMAVCANVMSQERAVPVKTIVDANVVKQKPLVQIAILLDTSNSMDGLINQAKAQLWSIVNEFIFAKRTGIAPEVQVALFEYGNNGLKPEQGHIREVVPFTTDLDKLSEELFALKTNGGQEYCGWVIKDAVEKLKWSAKADDLKLIFIAGNEPFTQGKVDFKESYKAAINKGIIVNTIHCGSESDGINGKWKDGAAFADGRFLNIDQNQAIVYIEAPQDKEISGLNEKLNETYIAYGIAGQERAQMQKEQDKNAFGFNAGAAMQRAVAKSSGNYINTAWDLIDAVKYNNVKIEEVTEKELPVNMQKMDIKQRKIYVDTKAKERAQIQAKIQKLNLEREKYVAEQLKNQTGQDKSFGAAAISAIQEQAKKKNFEFDRPQENPEKNGTEKPKETEK